MTLLDSRRLTGPNLLLGGPGAVVEVEIVEVAHPSYPADAVLPLWRERARRLLAAVGWGGERLAARRHAKGLSLALSAPLDALYAATEVAEEAWHATAAALAGRPGYPLEEPAARLRETIAAERNPRLAALSAAAAARGVAFLCDADQATVGLGTGSATWPVGALPAPREIDWGRVHDVPVAMVTGTNGKTTTVRLLAAVAAAAGRVAGLTSTDRIAVAGEPIDHGDYSGPGGARTLLRDRRVELAILETARGGILRRGLALAAADAAAVTNVAADHLGEYGIDGLADLAEAKLVPVRAVRPGGTAVLNADDPELARRGPPAARAPIAWFSLETKNPLLAGHLARGGAAAFLDGDDLVLAAGGRRRSVTRLADIPIAFGGAARYNAANALAAAALAQALGLSDAAIAQGLASVAGTPEDNPGRANLLELGGIHVLLDYAHNPHGLAALLEVAAVLPATRRLLIVGQAGDRDDDAIRELAATAWRLRPDHVVVKELPSMLRGRQEGEVPAILEDELRRQGAPAEALSRAADEPAAVERALAWARPGDLLVLLVHTDRDAVLARLEQAGARPAGGRVRSEA
ncbi:MAG TPA: Mur ligase family protein [Thermoanaerobaculia bacterium]